MKTMTQQKPSTKLKMDIKKLFITTYSTVGFLAAAGALILPIYQVPDYFTNSMSNGVVTDIKIEQIETLGAPVEESFECAWTVNCDNQERQDEFYRSSPVCIGYQTMIHNWAGGDATLAIPQYWPGTQSIGSYVFLNEDIYLGDVPPYPGGSLLITVNVTYDIPPQIQGNYTLDWVATLNHGVNNPPFDYFCGWPLSEIPDPYIIHL